MLPVFDIRLGAEREDGESGKQGGGEKRAIVILFVLHFSDAKILGGEGR